MVVLGRCAALAALLGGPAACFVGNAAEGLPCERDADCGLELKCENGCCGGTCDDVVPSTSAAETGSDDTTNSTRPSTSSSTMPTETGDAVCGDGVVEGGEECDDPDGNGDGRRCLAGCVMNTCGDGDQLLVGDQAEACDDGNTEDGDACTNDCTIAVCGDGVVRTVGPAPEECDEGGMDANDPFRECSRACQQPILHWDENMPATNVWCPDDACFAEGLPAGWTRDTQRVPAPYRTGGQVFPAGRQVLATRPFELPVAGDIQVRLIHTPNFEGCQLLPDPETWEDGGRVFLELVSSGTQLDLFPFERDPAAGLLTCTPQCNNTDPNPICDPPPADISPGPRAFRTSRSRSEVVRRDLRRTLGLGGGPLEARLIFEASYNCGFCDNAMPPQEDAWQIHEVSVAVVPPPPR